MDDNSNKLLAQEQIVELLRKQISSTNLYDRSTFNQGYREALRDMIHVIKNQ
jgi:hypothetical protein